MADSKRPKAGCCSFPPRRSRSPRRARRKRETQRTGTSASLRIRSAAGRLLELPRLRDQFAPAFPSALDIGLRPVQKIDQRGAARKAVACAIVRIDPIEGAIRLDTGAHCDTHRVVTVELALHRFLRHRGFPDTPGMHAAVRDRARRRERHAGRCSGGQDQAVRPLDHGAILPGFSWFDLARRPSIIFPNRNKSRCVRAELPKL
jgi:hypothetical protein